MFDWTEEGIDALREFGDKFQGLYIFYFENNPVQLLSFLGVQTEKQNGFHKSVECAA